MYLHKIGKKTKKNATVSSTFICKFKKKITLRKTSYVRTHFRTSEKSDNHQIKAKRIILFKLEESIYLHKINVR